MYELIFLTERLGYVNCPAKIGVYKINNEEIALIDSGKNTAWLGAERYPLVLVVYIVLFALGFLCMLCGVVRCVGKKLDKHSAK